MPSETTAGGAASALDVVRSMRSVGWPLMVVSCMVSPIFFEEAYGVEVVRLWCLCKGCCGLR